MFFSDQMQQKKSQAPALIPPPTPRGRLEVEPAMFDPSRSAATPENPVAADVQRRGLRELRKLPGSGAAASGAAASTKRMLHDTLQKRALQDGPEEGGDALPRPRQFRMSEPVVSSLVATEQAKLFHAIGMDLVHSLPEAAHG